MLDGERSSTFRQRALPTVDRTLLLSILGLLVIGLVMVYSASGAISVDLRGNSIHFLRVQLIAAAIGLVGAYIAMRVPMRVYSAHVKHAILLAVILMAATFLPVIGAHVRGFRRWIGIGPVQFQPVEFAKFAVILYVARFLSMERKNIRSLASGVLPNIIVMLLFVVLLIFQPDFGSAVLLCGVVFAMLLAGGARFSHLALLAIVAFIPAYLLIVTDEYRYARILTFLKWIGGTAPAPDEKGYQIWQSYNALSSGGLAGVGLGDGLYKLFYLPAPHTDFIFTVIGEELGFIGGTIVIGLYGIIVLRGIQIALQVRDTFMKLLAFGISMSLGMQAIVNIGMALGLLPTKGFTLPFLSYGGSSLVMSLIQIGVLLNVSQYARRDSTL